MDSFFVTKYITCTDCSNISRTLGSGLWIFSRSHFSCRTSSEFSFLVFIMEFFSSSLCFTSNSFKMYLLKFIICQFQNFFLSSIVSTLECPLIFVVVFCDVLGLLSPSYNVSLDAAQCATTDGTFLYFKSTDGSLLKIGTGLNNTIRNLIYCSNPTFRGNYNLADDLIYHKHRLFYRCASMSKNTFQILNSETLKAVIYHIHNIEWFSSFLVRHSTHCFCCSLEQIENTITTETNSNLSEKVNFIKLATDGNRLFSLEYISHLTSQHSEWVVDIYSFDDTTLQLSHLRRLILQPPQGMYFSLLSHFFKYFLE